jgi:hypothetical protein
MLCPFIMNVLLLDRNRGRSRVAQQSSDPVAAITEAEATGATAALYRDIRATLGVPVVNLIWRHLATFPGALPWAWHALKPLYDRGAIQSQAFALRQGLAVPVCPGLSSATLAAIGLSATDLESITTVLGSYERSNSMNMIALATLATHLEGAAPANAPGAHLSAPKEPALDGTMPTLPALDDMAPNVRELVEALSVFGGVDAILPTMYRHLAHWPGYLALIHVLLAPVAQDGRLADMIKAAKTEGRQRAATLALELSDDQAPAAAPIDKTTRTAVLAAANQFTNGPLAKMIAVVAIIQAAMPTDQQRG